MNFKVAEGIVGISVHDKEIARFEGQYPVPDGITYNSWVIEDDQTILLDTADSAFTGCWLRELSAVLGEKKPDKLVISHVEPDHSGSIAAFVEAYPDVTLVGNAKTFAMLDQFFPQPVKAARQIVKDGDVLETANHRLRFVFAPMVHWPEVMLAFDEATGTLFSADAFGTFGALERIGGWTDEARRYYGNIVGKYGAQVQAVLKKAAQLPVKRLCPLHGPVLEEQAMSEALASYEKWSAWQPESDGTLIVCAGFHGHTLAAAERIRSELTAAGREAALVDLTAEDKSYAVGLAFRYGRIVLAATTYDGAYAPAMEAFISSMKMKGLQNRLFGLVENGTWAPMAAKQMAAALEGLKSCRVLEEKVTLRSAMNAKNEEEIRALCEALYA